MMNTKRILELADIIEKMNHVHDPYETDFEHGELSKFSMTTYRCGTAGCIAGWVCHLWSGDDIEFGYEEIAQELLHIDDYISNDLFMGMVNRDVTKNVTPTMAAACLRNLVETGEVDWVKAGVTWWPEK